ncbi:methyltransferase domain-containing protein [Paraburkholderia susongensis]|uniref:Methyltransferase domain-containing protein n=1 Tax=Paraburkholderia susongensis TaxID=1515439 RepID=A0A1X7LRS2_9BURK|nr:methyltransferase domain-containing protein [Paraburkholderia susongensis]SMG56525.1 Methyltransferase domain-containing protein [Paraburkholderia susongensis]
MVIELQLESVVVPYDENLLERARTQWQFGDWERLSKIDKEMLRHHPERARLAMLVAASHLQIDNNILARQFLQLAREWGCSKKLIAQILTAGALNSLGRAAVLAGDMPRALRHFESSIQAGTPGADTRLIAMARSSEQLAQVQRLNTCAAHNATTSQDVHVTQVDSKADNSVRAVESVQKSEIYNKAFYDEQRHGSESSAREVLPALFRYFKPRTMIDIGCGVGTWVKVAKELGVEFVLGVDGSYAIAGLVIPEASFVPHDLGQPLGNLGRFDLAMSLEVAEHLDASRADGFVADLCGLSDAILFSAAIPHQGGADHRNENWPEYWATKFEKHGYVPLDFLREILWTNSKVEWWYRQNVLVFVREVVLEKVFGRMERAPSQYLTRIHPDLLIKRATRR